MAEWSCLRGRQTSAIARAVERWSGMVVRAGGSAIVAKCTATGTRLNHSIEVEEGASLVMEDTRVSGCEARAWSVASVL